MGRLDGAPPFAKCVPSSGSLGMNFRSTGEGWEGANSAKFIMIVLVSLKVLGSSRVWGKCYTTVPVLVRRLLDLSEGSEIEWVLNDDGSMGGEKNWLTIRV